MNSFAMFLKLTKANIKRISRYYAAIVIATVILFLFCGLVSRFLSENFYKEKIFEKFCIAYYLPEDTDLQYNTMAVSMISELSGMKETTNLIQVNSVEEGYRMLENGSALYLIIVPEDFLRGIMYGYNYPLEIVVRDHSSIASYIANELFLAYGRYLGTAQAAVYSGIDVAVENGMSAEDIQNIQDRINFTFLDRSLNKDTYINKIKATNEGSYTLLEHYLAVAVIMTICFMSFILIPAIQGYSKGIKTKLDVHGIKSFQILLSNTIAIFPAFYISFAICYIALLCINHRLILPLGFVIIIPVLFVISFITSCISMLSKNQLTAGLFIFLILFAVLYIGGGFIPDMLLPQIIQRVSDIMPFRFFISSFEHALF